MGATELLNGLAPVNQLPPEILGAIPKYQQGQTSKELVAICSVCSYWRDTFITTPSLWTNLNGRGIEKSRAWVERSRSLPIQLMIKDSPDVRVLEFLQPYSSRLDVVELIPRLESEDPLVVPRDPIAKLLRSSFSLRVLHIGISDLFTFDPPMIMSGEFPSLEQLHITGYSVSIPNLRTPNLRDLFLVDTRDLADLLDLLEASPLLKYLTLHFESVGDMSMDRREAITGRKVILKKIEFAKFIRGGSAILQHLLLPPGGYVELMEDAPFGQLDGITSGYVQLLSRAFDNLPMTRQAESLTFDTTDRRGKVLSLKGPNGTLKLIMFTSDGETAINMLIYVFAQHSAESIRHLNITQPDYFPNGPQPVSDLLRRLDNLQSIVIHQSRKASFRWLSAMGTSYCRRLQDLTFEDLPPGPITFFNISPLVRARSEAGIPIRRLTVTHNPGISMPTAWLETLREYAEFVSWG